MLAAGTKVLAAFSYWIVFIEERIVVIAEQIELLGAKLQEVLLHRVLIVYITSKQNIPKLNIGNFDAT